VEIAQAFVTLRPKADGSFEAQARTEIEGPLKRIAATAAGLFASREIAQFFRAGIAELGEAQRVSGQVEARIRSTGGAANVSAKQVDELAESTADLAGADQEVITQGISMLLTFKNVANEVGSAGSGDRRLRIGRIGVGDARQSVERPDRRDDRTRTGRSDVHGQPENDDRGARRIR
jgi:hypothetical protein